MHTASNHGKHGVIESRWDSESAFPHGFLSYSRTFDDIKRLPSTWTRVRLWVSFQELTLFLYTQPDTHIHQLWSENTRPFQTLPCHYKKRSALCTIAEIHKGGINRLMLGELTVLAWRNGSRQFHVISFTSHGSNVKLQLLDV
jgi:hypothetical protein